MKSKLLLVSLILVLCACMSRAEKERKAYRLVLSCTEREYTQSAERGYAAEVRFAKYVEASLKRGTTFPDKKLLMWIYARAGVAAEFAGHEKDAQQMYAVAEANREQLYPGQPFDKSGQFKTIRDAVLFMDRNAGVSWLKKAP